MAQSLTLTEFLDTQTVAERLDKGNTAELDTFRNEETGQTWVKRICLSGISLEWELAMSLELAELGMAPAVEPFLENGYMLIQLIDDGIALRDILLGLSSGYGTCDQARHIGAQMGKLLYEFWHAGYIHGDLHTGNIVFSLATVQPFLIDFTTTFQDTETGRREFRQAHPEFQHLRLCSREEEEAFLIECIEDYYRAVTWELGQTLIDELLDSLSREI
ncbi:protein kinase family protein [Thermosynechococcus sp. FA-CM-4201]